MNQFFSFSLSLLLLVAGTTAKCCDMDFMQNYSFKYLSVNNGLSQNSITSIIQDSKGFIWIATYDGLNRYDGFTIQTKRHISNNRNSLSDNRILCLYENNKGHILIGTDGGGINILNPRLDQILHINIKSSALQSNVIQALTTDMQNNIWAGTDKGIAVFTEPSDKNPSPKVTYLAALKDKNIKSLMRDVKGNIWVGTDQGLFVFEALQKETLKINRLKKVSQIGNTLVTALYQDNNNNIWVGVAGRLFKIKAGSDELNELSGNNYIYNIGNNADITAIAQDLNGDLWVSTKFIGIFKFKLDNQQQILFKYQYNTGKPFCNIAENSVNTLFIDKSNTLWAGTYQKGINYTDLSTKNFYSFYPLMNNEVGIFGYKGKYISAVSETSTDLWIGTFNEGLYIYNKCDRKITAYNSIINSTSICTIYQAKDKTIWIGGNNGLHKVDKPNSTGKKGIRAIKNGFIARSICEDNFGNLWIATWEGVLKYNPATNQFTTITAKDGISSNSVYVVYQDPYAPIIWTGTIGGGLNSIKYDRSGNYKISSLIHRENELNSLSSNHVWCLYRDKSNFLWVGTDAGLNKLSLDSASNVTAYKAVNIPLLKDRKIMAILEDNAKNLWLSSSQGLFKFSINDNMAKQYTHQDGLQSNTLTEAAYKNDEGMMYFGGINGLNYFKAELIKSNPFKAKTAFTDFRVFNRSVKIGEQINDDIILRADINYTEEIVLSYKQKDFAIAFSSLHYVAPENNKFKYKLEGYDNDWIVTDYSQRIAAYSNLAAGNYKFMVTSSNNDEFYPDEVKSINFVIKPAPWATWWAKTLYVATIAAIILFLINYFRTRHQLKNEIYKEKLEKEKVTELNEIKLSFFTNITHEIRTPLNLIISPLQDLLNVAPVYDHFTSMRLKIIHRNSLKLYALINQILDLRKISSEAEKLVIREADLALTLLSVKESFNWMAEQNNIRFDFRSQRKVNAWFDKDKIEKVVFNLLSNAFKYTPSGGIISVLFYTSDGKAIITVKDTGIGIHHDEQDKVFEMYYQSTAHHNSGTGIGLALSKKLIEMHNGQIKLNSSGNGGSEFTITFPIDKHSFMPDNIYENFSEHHNLPEPELVEYTSAQGSKMDEIHLSKKSVLIIEDNDDQRAYLKDCLLPYFHILDAANGIDGLECAQKYQPDIIITDLMMPSLDGTDVCRKIKSNVKTSHIPVIVHSIKNNTQSIKDALLAGADDFVAKPYDYSMLTLKINNILNSKNKLVLNIHKQEIITPTEVIVPSLDKELLKKIVSYVEENISDTNFSVEKLCDHIGMSRMNLHRRLHAIIGKTASEFIREVRIKRAGQLLGSGSKRISEVMFEIGISSNAHFNRYFKEMYGVSPKEYIKQAEHSQNIQPPLQNV